MKIHLIDYLKSFLGTPYKWGGETPFGIDCSGLGQEFLRAVGIDPPGDQTAQGLYDYFLEAGKVSSMRAGAFVFYGSHSRSIIHVGIAIDDVLIVEAGGGDSTVTTKESAEKKKAFVRMRPYNYRPDFITASMPPYPEWVKL